VNESGEPKTFIVRPAQGISRSVLCQKQGPWLIFRASNARGLNHNHTSYALCKGRFAAALATEQWAGAWLASAEVDSDACATNEAAVHRKSPSRRLTATSMLARHCYWQLR
jgi:hypothetical protein